MKIQPIENTRDNSFEYVKTGAIGAVAGYGLKYAMPLSANENADTFTKSAVNSIGKQIEESRIEKLDAIIERTKNGETRVDKEILPLLDANKKEIAKLDVEGVLKNLAGVDTKMQAKVIEVLNCVEKAGEKTAEKAQNALKLATKHNRSTFYFMSIGAIAGLGYQILKQSLTPDLEFVSKDEKIYF